MTVYVCVSTAYDWPAINSPINLSVKWPNNRLFCIHHPLPSKCTLCLLLSVVKDLIVQHTCAPALYLELC